MDILALSKQDNFQELVDKIYQISKENDIQYPQYKSWYYNKAIPRILEGKGEIFLATINDEIVGFVNIKNDDEKKICTLYIIENYRKKGIATKLLENAFSYLETTKPLITIPAYNEYMFQKIIKKYDWKRTGCIYNYSSVEYVYNENKA